VCTVGQRTDSSVLLLLLRVLWKLLFVDCDLNLFGRNVIENIGFKVLIDEICAVEQANPTVVLADLSA
jgi:hypothetical protein